MRKQRVYDLQPQMPASVKMDRVRVQLVCLVLFVFFTGRNALRVIRWRSATPQLVGLQLWLISVLAGNQGSLWILSNTASGFIIFAVAGLAAKASTLATEQTAPDRRFA